MVELILNTNVKIMIFKYNKGFDQKLIDPDKTIDVKVYIMC